MADYMGTNGLPLFDAQESERRKETGITLATNVPNREAAIQEAREVARHLARQTGTCTADDVVRYYAQRGVSIHARLGNAMGGLFRGNEWEWTGSFIKSQQVRNHARLQRVWRLA